MQNKVKLKLQLEMMCLQELTNGYYSKKLKIEKCNKLIKEVALSKSTISFNKNLSNLVKKYRRLENSILSINFLKNYLKIIKLICKLSGNEF